MAWEEEKKLRALFSIIYVLTRNDEGDKGIIERVNTPAGEGKEKC